MQIDTAAFPGYLIALTNSPSKIHHYKQTKVLLALYHSLKI